MIAGVGTDLIEMERIMRACQKDAFVTRAFTAKECRQAEGSPSRLAGNFAVKEAVSKVFGTGFRGIGLQEIEVLRDPLGKPYVVLHGRARELAGQLGIRTIHVSISNTKEYAMAFAVGEGGAADETKCDGISDETD